MTEEEIELLKAAGGIQATAIVAAIGVADPALGVLLTGVLATANSLFGYMMKVRIKKVVELIEFLQKNPQILTTAVWQEENFQDGFINFLEYYVRERNAKKRGIAQAIFLGLATSKQKDDFELERLVSTLSLIGIEGLQYLYFIKNELYLVHAENVQSRYKSLAKAEDDHPEYEAPTYEVLFRTMKPLQYITRPYWRSKCPNENGIDELVTLGLIKHLPQEVEFKEGVAIEPRSNRNRIQYDITPFGYTFLDFIE